MAVGTAQQETEEGLLRHIFRHRLISKNADGGGEDERCMPPHELGKGIGIAPLGVSPDEV